MIIKRNVTLKISDTSSITAKMLSVSEWLNYESEKALVDPSDTIATLQFTTRVASQWITEIQGFEFEDGTPLSLSDVGFLPISCLIDLHSLVITEVTSYLGKR
jgi:hypothetical protein